MNVSNVCLWGNLRVVVLGSPHDFDKSDRVHENLAQQKNVETIYTELDAYTHTYIHYGENIIHIHAYIHNTHIHTLCRRYITHTYILGQVILYIHSSRNIISILHVYIHSSILFITRTVQKYSTYIKRLSILSYRIVSYRIGQIRHVLEVDAVVADHVHLVLGRIRQRQREKRVLVPAP